MSISRIDPDLKFLTVGQLKKLKIDDFKVTTAVIQDAGTPFAVVLPYQDFMELQARATPLTPLGIEYPLLPGSLHPQP